MASREYHGYLTRCPDGRYVFSGLKPRVRTPLGGAEQLVYPVVGDPFFTGIEKTWCEDFVHGCGVEPTEPLVSHPAVLSIRLKGVGEDERSNRKPNMEAPA